MNKKVNAFKQISDVLEKYNKTTDYFINNPYRCSLFLALIRTMDHEKVINELKAMGWNRSALFEEVISFQINEMLKDLIQGE